MTFQIILLLVQHIFLPGYFIYSLWQGKERSRFQWLLKVAYSGLYILLIFLIGRWDWVSYYLRFIIPALYLVAVYVSYHRTKALSFLVKEKEQRDWFRIGEAGFVILLLGYFFILTVPGYFHTPEAVRLTFPLEDGWYYAGQAGNSPRINQHNDNRAQKFAMDILELNTAGLRAERIYPTQLDKFFIFGETIHSPCDGEVIAAVDGLPDNIPPERDQEHLAGNHIVLACRGVRVLLAHMKKGSLTVETGMEVHTGQRLGSVGNSGNTTEPHLHIHAVEGDSQGVMVGVGVPIHFEGKFPVRNMVFLK